MHPVLIDIGPLQIRSYGFMLALSFLAGMYVAARRARRFGVEPQHILDLSVYIILAAVVGSRLLYAVFHLDEFESPLEFFALWHGGATYYGGLLGAMLASYIYLTRKKLAFLLVADIVAPSIALGEFLTRIGCFLSGCCYGKPTTHAWGVVFPPDSAAGRAAVEMSYTLGLTTVTLHPAQLYASAYGLLITAVLLLSSKRLETRRGATFGLLLVLYGVARFSVDFVRYYEPNAHVLLGLTFNQVISVALFALGVFLLARRAPAAARA